MNTAAISIDWVGRVIDGRFSLLQWLGGAGGAGVFLTELSGQGSQKAVIKLIPADAVDAESHIAGWDLTKTLSHPHLMRLFHTGRYRIDTVEVVYTVTEFAEEDLSQILPERALTPTEVEEMLDPILDTLSFLHKKHFVHGHLKPSNIMVVDNQLKLSGESLEVEGDPCKPFRTLGAYDAPETATEPISPKADVWALGVILVEALTQRTPVWNRSRDKEPVVPESVPEPFAGIARECLRSDPARRSTLSQVKARLEPAQPLPEPPQDISALPVPANKTARTEPTRLRRLTLIAAVLVLVAVIAVLFLRSHHSESSAPSGKQSPVTKIPETPAQSPISGSQISTGAAVKGIVAERVLPDVPRGAISTIRGTVKVAIRVTADPSGNVSNAAFESPGPSKYFAKLALEAARNWKFKSARVDGHAVSSVWNLQFQFKRTGVEVTPIETSP